MMVKPDQLQLVNLISRKGNSGEVRHSQQHGSNGSGSSSGSRVRW